MISEPPMNRRDKQFHASHNTYHHHAQVSRTSDHRTHREIDAHKQRVTQTNMVYLIGLPKQIANQQLLATYEFCGQYGDILKILVKKGHFNDYASYSAYITYSTDEAASMAILGINDLLYGRAKIYASYGTNKYCSTFIKFGRCRKQNCPFSHQIQEDKEIKEDDNKKLFQEQQLIARSYVIKNYESLVVFDESNTNAFPSKYEVIQGLIADGLIKIPKREEPEIIQPRYNALKQIQLARSEISTQCSPQKLPESEPDSPIVEIQQNVQVDIQEKIIPKIRRKLKFSGKSILGFHKGAEMNVREITNMILSGLEMD